MRVAVSDQRHRIGATITVLGALLATLALALLFTGVSFGGGPSNVSQIHAAYSPATNGVVSFWEQRIVSDPADYVAFNKLADAYLRRARETGEVGDYARAEAAVSESLRLQPEDNYPAIVRIASLKNTAHEFADAATSARRAIGIDPTDPYGYAVLGDAQLALGLYDEARHNYELIVAEAPGLSSFSRLAHVLEIQGDVAGADLAWQNALSTDAGRRPENTAWAQKQYGDFLFRIGDLDTARRRYEDSVDSVPGYTHGLAGVASVEAARGHFDAAIERYQLVVGRMPLPEYVAALGDVFAAVGRNDDATSQYEIVSAIAELYRSYGVNVDQMMALFFADHGLNIDDAVRQAEAAYERSPESVYSADALAWALMSAGRPDEAQPYARQAIRLGTPDASLYFHAGMISYALGDLEAAREDLRQAASLNVNFSVLYAETLTRTIKELKAR